jgi:hypothetical protein
LIWTGSCRGLGAVCRLWSVPAVFQRLRPQLHFFLIRFCSAFRSQGPKSGLIRVGFSEIYSKLIYNLAEIEGLVLKPDFFRKRRNLRIFGTSGVPWAADCSGFRNKQMQCLRRERQKQVIQGRIG